MSSLLEDLRAAGRRMRVSPGAAAGVVATLALGIAAVVVLHAVLQTVLLAPLPYPEPERLVLVHELDPQGARFVTSEPNYLDFAQAEGVQDLAAVESRAVTLNTGSRPLRAEAAFASAELFPLLGVEPSHGRVYDRDEDEPGGAPVAVLGAALADRLGGEPQSWVDRTLRIGGEAYTVLGVVPGDFAFPPGAELWLPLRAEATADRGDHWLSVVGRLAPGVERETAESELRTIAQRLSAEYPETNRGWSAELEPMAAALLGDLPSRLWSLGAAAAVLLLLACGNAAGLLLVQGVARRRELAVRSALGASRRALVQKLLMEGLVLAVAAALLGVGAAVLLLPWVRGVLADVVPRGDQITLGLPTLGIAVGVALLTALMSSLAPARRAVDGVAAGGLRGRDGGLDRGASRLQRGLIVAQVTLATLLLLVGGLFARSLLTQRSFDPGYDLEDTLIVPLSLQRAGLSGDQVTATVAEIEQQVAALPGVSAVGVSNIRPFSGSSTVAQIAVEGRPASGPEDAPFVNWRLVSPSLFEVAGARALAGDLFRDREPTATTGDDVVVVSRELAALVFPELPLAQVVGKRLAFGWNGDNFQRIVGVVPELRDVPLDRDARPTMYLPYGGWPDVTLMVRAEAPPAVLAEPLRRAIWEVDDELAVPTVSTLVREFRGTLIRPRLQAGLLGALALVAVTLSLVGLVGVLAYSVRRRRSEIGVRKAVGAVPREIGRIFLGEGLRLAAAGVGLGLLLSLGVARAVESQLFEVSGWDPRVFAAVALLLMTAAGLAAVGPALRASRQDVVSSLRSD